MRVHVEFMAFIERPKGLSRKFDKGIPEGTSVQQLLSNMGYTLATIRQMQFFVSSSTSKEESQRVGRSYELQHADHLFVTIPIGGG